jgi:hypothetical protein
MTSPENAINGKITRLPSIRSQVAGLHTGLESEAGEGASAIIPGIVAAPAGLAASAIAVQHRSVIHFSESVYTEGFLRAVRNNTEIRPVQ